MPQIWLVPGTCRTVCSQKRANRPFTPQDVARIASYARDSGFPVYQVLGGALAGVGLAVGACVLARVLADVVDFLGTVRRVVGVLGILQLIALLQRLRAFLLRLPVPSRFAIIIPLLSAFISLFIPSVARILAIEEKLRMLKEISATITESCDWLQSSPTRMARWLKGLAEEAG